MAEYGIRRSVPRHGTEGSDYTNIPDFGSSVLGSVPESLESLKGTMCENTLIYSDISPLCNHAVNPLYQNNMEMCYQWV